jgi:DNA-directed RNA polymerase subunit M/transcription elongation factor TFIIS
MASVDPAQQWRELTENYRHMTDGELCRVAADAADLIPVAQEALRAVMAERGVTASSANSEASQADPLATDENEEVDPRYLETPDEYELIPVREVYNEEEAAMAKSILDANFIACCFGPDDTVELKDFKGSFAGGVDLKVLRRDSRQAQQSLDAFAPRQEAEEDKEAESSAFAVSCPKCHSEEIIFEGNDPESAGGKFNWTCDHCGHEWKDDGIAEAV